MRLNIHVPGPVAWRVSANGRRRKNIRRSTLRGPGDGVSAILCSAAYLHPGFAFGGAQHLRPVARRVSQLVFHAGPPQLKSNKDSSNIAATGPTRRRPAHPVFTQPTLNAKSRDGPAFMCHTDRPGACPASLCSHAAGPQLKKNISIAAATGPRRCQPSAPVPRSCPQRKSMRRSAFMPA
jgi:hypothetical protein